MPLLFERWQLDMVMEEDRNLQEHQPIKLKDLIYHNTTKKSSMRIYFTSSSYQGIDK